MSKMLCPSCFAENVAVIEYPGSSDRSVVATLQCDTCGRVWHDRVPNPFADAPPPRWRTPTEKP